LFLPLPFVPTAHPVRRCETSCFAVLVGWQNDRHPTSRFAFLPCAHPWAPHFRFLSLRSFESPRKSWGKTEDRGLIPAKPGLTCDVFDSDRKIVREGLGWVIRVISQSLLVGKTIGIMPLVLHFFGPPIYGRQISAVWISHPSAPSALSALSYPSADPIDCP